MRWSDPDDVARAVVMAMLAPRSRVDAGVAARLLSLRYGLAPVTVEWVMSRVLPRRMLSDQPAPDTEGTVRSLEHAH